MHRRRKWQPTPVFLPWESQRWGSLGGCCYGVAQSQTQLKRPSSSSSSSSNDNPIFETAKETQMYRTVFWTLWERARVGWSEGIALKHVYYHIWNRSPVQVWCMRQGAQDWCTGMTLRDGMGWEVGGGFRRGNTCTPMADSSECMAKTTTIL